MTPETLIWRPGRVRVFARANENPWFRTGSIARDHRAFYDSLSGPDRQEEDEDWEIVAPRRPTRSWTPGEEHWTFVVDEEHFASLPVEFEDLEPDPDPVAPRMSPQEHKTKALAERARAREARRKRVEAKRLPWRITLERERNYEILAEFDDRLIRHPGGHVYPPEHLPRFELTDTRGFRRWVTSKQALLIIERGDIEKETRMIKMCPASGCIAPDHHDVE